MSAKVKDLSKEKIGKLQPLYQDKSKIGTSAHAYWICQCDCGKIKSISSRGLAPTGTSRSCGCAVILKKELRNNRILTQSNKDIQIIKIEKYKKFNSLKYQYKCNCGYIGYCYNLDRLKCFKCNINKRKIRYQDIPYWYYRNVKKSANKRNILFNITIEDMNTQFQKQRHLCAYTQELLIIGYTRKTEKLTTASLDRIDSNKDYTIDNIQWIHKDINKLKTDFDHTRFIELCEKVVYGKNYSSSNCCKS